MNNPNLAPPGAGLPGIEPLLLRRIAFPLLKLRLNQKSALNLFQSSGSQILAMVQDVDEHTFTEPVLIPRLLGMEDSSRNWSAELTLEHIQVVTAAALFIIKKLEANQPVDLPVRTQDVKPNGGLGLDRIRAFRTYLEETPKKIAAFEFKSQATHHHPWFGELKSIDWLRLIAFHQDLHRKQVERILFSPG